MTAADGQLASDGDGHKFDRFNKLFTCQPNLFTEAVSKSILADSGPTQ